MTSEDEDGQLQYDGHLLFNELCRTSEVENPNLTQVSRSVEGFLLDQMLERFEQGNSRDPGDGFERSQVRDYSTKLPEGTQKFIDSLVALRYRNESYNTEEAEVEVGKRKNVKIPEETSVDVFWDSPNYLLVRGAENEAEEARENLQSNLSGNASVKTVRLSFDFLLWLFYKHTNEESLSSKLETDRLANAEAKGSEDLLGKTSIVEDAPDVRDAPNFLLCLVHGKSVSMLEGDFVIQTGPENDEEESVRVEIQPEKIQIKASKAGLRNSEKIEKMGFATQVAHEILRVYNEWDNKDPSDSDKIVPPDFIAEMLKRCHEQGVDIHNESTVLRVLKQQARRRDEDLEEYDLSDALEFLSEDEETDTEEDAGEDETTVEDEDGSRAANDEDSDEGVSV